MGVINLMGEYPFFITFHHKLFSAIELFSNAQFGLEFDFGESSRFSEGQSTEETVVSSKKGKVPHPGDLDNALASH